MLKVRKDRGLGPISAAFSSPVPERPSRASSGKDQVAYQRVRRPSQILEHEGAGCTCTVETHYDDTLGQN